MCVGTGQGAAGIFEMLNQYQVAGIKYQENKTMHNFKELKIWQESMSLAKDIFALTRKFPTEEKYGLISQLNRAVVSVPSNIAEGAGRDSQKEFNQFLNISLGSSFEIETQLILANEFNYISKEELQTLTEKVTKIQKMICKLKDSIRQPS